MNQIQRGVLLAVAIAMVAMLIYPPVMRGQHGMGYGWIFDLKSRYLRVDAAQLIVQWIGLLIVGGIFFALTKGYEIKPLQGTNVQSEQDAGDPRGAFVRAVDWAIPGFVLGFLITGDTLVSDFEKRIGGGILLAMVTYLVSAVYIKIRAPLDRGHGGMIGFLKRLGIVLAFTAAAGVLMAILIPAFMDRF